MATHTNGLLAAALLLLLAVTPGAAEESRGGVAAPAGHRARRRLGFFSSWGWCLPPWDCDDDDADSGNGGNTRPSDRAQVICSAWCPSGYSRREVTIGPTCSWNHWFGKCVDNNAYEFEGCDAVPVNCQGNLVCDRSAPSSAQAASATCVAERRRALLDVNDTTDVKRPNLNVKEVDVSDTTDVNDATDEVDSHFRESATGVNEDEEDSRTQTELTAKKKKKQESAKVLGGNQSGSVKYGRPKDQEERPEWPKDKEEDAQKPEGTVVCEDLGKPRYCKNVASQGCKAKNARKRCRKSCGLCQHDHGRRALRAEDAAQLRQRRELRNLVCDPANCVLARFEFTKGRTECSSCMPEDGKYRCPAAQSAAGRGNAYEAAMAATFSGGFGGWSTGQCEHDSYSPSPLAFSGPGAWDDHFVPACPTAQFCACGEVRDKIRKLMFDRASLSRREQSDLYWASLAGGFTLAQGFSAVSGGSAEHFDLVYEHGDGRRQFCSGVQSFSYSPQLEHDAGPHTYVPGSYTTPCKWGGSPDGAFGGCDEDYREVSRSYCWWPPAFSEVCEPKLQDRTERSALPSRVVQASDTPRAWTAWGSWGSCSESCGGGSQSRSRVPSSGSGAHVTDPRPAGASTESRSCNTQACPSCSWWQFWC